MEGTTAFSKIEMTMDATTRNAIFYSLAIAVGGFVFGFDASVIGGVLGHVTPLFDLEPWQIGLLVSAPTLAAIGASFSLGFISDLAGRKRTMFLLATLYLVSAIGSAFAWDFISLTIARGIGGYAFGALAQAPVYIAELSPPRLRGRLVAINQMTIVVGISTAYFTNLAIQNLANSGVDWTVAIGLAQEPWRWMLGLLILPAALWLIALIPVPESARWLATKGRWDEARASLAKVVPAAEVQQALKDMADQFDQAVAKGTSRFAELFGPRVRFALLIGVIVAVAQQITGINTVFFYATTIFEQSGVGTDAAFSQAVLVGLINVVFTILAMSMIDRLGRRPLMIVGLLGVLVSLSMVAYGFHSATYVLSAADLAAGPTDFNTNALRSLVGVPFADDVSFKQALAGVLGAEAARDNEAMLLSMGMKGSPLLILSGILGFVASFALSLGPVMWVLLSEIFPNRIRGVAISLVTVFNSGASWLVQFMFPIQVSTTGIAGVFAGYAAFALLGLLLVIWLMPETKGRTLEQLEDDLARRRVFQ